MKDFSPKNSNIPILEKYEEGKDYGDQYWSTWEKKDYEATKGSLVDHEALVRVATRVGYPDMRKVQYIARFLTAGPATSSVTG